MVREVVVSQWALTLLPFTHIRIHTGDQLCITPRGHCSRWRHHCIILRGGQVTAHGGNIASCTQASKFRFLHKSIQSAALLAFQGVTLIGVRRPRAATMPLTRETADGCHSAYSAPI